MQAKDGLPLADRPMRVKLTLLLTPLTCVHAGNKNTRDQSAGEPIGSADGCSGGVDTTEGINDKPRCYGKSFYCDPNKYHGRYLLGLTSTWRYAVRPAIQDYR